MEDTISIAGLGKPEVLAALVNAGQQQGLGLLHQNTHMTRDDAAQVLLSAGERGYLDYVMGKPIKTDFSGDEIDPYLYDRDHGPGAARRAIDALR